MVGFRRALEAFEAAEEPAGLYLAWLGLMDGIMYRNDTLAEVPHWLAELKRLQARFGPPGDPALAGRVAFTAFNMGFTACPDSRGIHDWHQSAERLRQGLPAILDPTGRCLAASCLAMFFTWHPRPSRLTLLAEALQPLIDDEAVAPLARVIASPVEITRRWNDNDRDGTLEFIDQALALAERHGILVGNLWLLSAAIIYCLTQQDHERGEVLLRRYRSHIRPANRHEQVHYHYLAAWSAWLQGELLLAREHIDRACADIGELHSPH